MIRCITIGKYITIQGFFVASYGDGTGTVRVGNREHTGQLL